MLTKKEKRLKAQQRLYQAILKGLNLRKVISIFDIKDTRWAMNRFVLAERAKESLLKKKSELETELRELEDKL
jgi:hypothetical protein